MKVRFLQILLLWTFIIMEGQPCTAGVDQCISCINGSQCRSCNIGYGLVDVTIPGQSITIICQPCPANCRQCTYSNSCTECNGYYRLTVNGAVNICAACTIPYCYHCVNSPNVCTTCAWAYRVNVNGDCQHCMINFCGRCDSGLYDCTACWDGYGLSNGTCQTCLQPNCYKCTSDVNSCWYCYSGFGAYNGQCIPCNLTNCANCSMNAYGCVSCISGYGLYGGACVECASRNCNICMGNNADICTSCVDYYGLSGSSCVRCLDITCKICTYDYTNCTECMPGSGILNGVSGNPCRVCFYGWNCATCSPFNNSICTSCNPGFYFLSNFCYSCPATIAYCIYCDSSTNCLVCLDGYFRNSAGWCTLCPNYCTLCVYNVSIGYVQCTQCQTYFQLSNVQPTYCWEICGDLVDVILPCDNQIGVLFDGCNDTCQIQNGFNCSILVVNESMCSYQLPIVMSIIDVQRQQFGNSITIRISVYPPLYVFQISDLKSVFLITDPIFTVNSVQFDPSTGEVVMKAGFGADYLNKDLVVEFVPDEAVNVRYFASVNSSASYLVDLKHYDDWILTLTPLIPFVCYAIAILGLVAAVIGLISKRLAGLEAMFVYQVAWLTMVWLNTSLKTPFENTNPLRYATGYHQPLFGTETQTGKASEDEYPHMTSFFLDRTIFANNFNIFFVLQVLSLIFSLVFGPIVKSIRNRQNQLKETRQIQQLQKLKIKHDRLNLVKQASMQSLMFFGSFNLLRFITCTFLFFRYNTDPFSHIPSIVLFGSACFVYLMTLILFYFDPDPFDYFRYSFRKTVVALHFYYVYISVYICTILLVLFLQLYFAPAIPLLCLLIFILIYKPYKEKMENFRSIFNIIVMISWLSMRIFYHYYISPFLSYGLMFLLVDLLLLFIVIIISWISLIYYIIYECYMKRKKEKTDEQKVMCELEMVNVRQNMQNIKENDIIFKRLLAPNMNIIDLSNSAMPLTELHTFEHQYASTQSKRNRKIRKQLQMQKLATTRNLLNQKKCYINQLKQKMQEQQQDLKKQQREENKKIIYALQVVTGQNKFIRLKNANDYTQKLLKQQQQQNKQEKKFFMNSYNQI